MSRSNSRPDSEQSGQAKLSLQKVEARNSDNRPSPHREAKQQSDLAADFWLARTAFQRGEYAKAIELTRGMNDRIALATKVRREAVPGSPSAAVVVVSHKASPAVSNLLAAVKEQAAAIGAEVVFVDNGNDSLAEIVESTFDSFTYLRPPFNVGCSAARNLGTRYTTADIVVFVDDDGIIEPGFLKALIDRMRATGAAACRGRVLPLDAHTIKPPHYDLGPNCVPTIPNTEGASAWRRELFDEFQGFDILLAGHEGFKLCAEAYRFFGALGFLYEPLAIMRHDYALTEIDAERKTKTHSRLDQYLEFCKLRPDAIRSLFLSTRRNYRERYLVARWDATPRPVVPSEGKPRISVLTTAKNGADFIDDYTRAWKSQSCRDFEIVFVDDGSTDDTKAKIRAAWRDDPRLRLIESEGIGRSAALNLALANSRTDLCMIDDVDDISRFDRTSWTLDFFSTNPDFDCVSFYMFDERSSFITGRPSSPFAWNMTVRQMLGTPVSFPAFAFRKNAFPLSFDPELRATVDYDWLARNFRTRKIRGRMVPVPLTYRRIHDGQISARHRAEQDAKAIEIIQENFAAIMGPLRDADKALLDRLMERAPTSTQTELSELYEWLVAILAQNRRLRIYDPDQLDDCLLTNFSNIRVAGERASLRGHSTTMRKSFSELFARGVDLYRSGKFKHSARLFMLAADRDPSSEVALRSAAEAYIANGNSRMARRVLRQAQALNPSDRGIGRRLHATRWPFRALRDRIAPPFSLH